MVDQERDKLFEMLERIVDGVADIEAKDDLSYKKQMMALLDLKDLVAHLGIDISRFCPGGRVPADRFKAKRCPEGPVPAEILKSKS